ncbi:MAG: TPR end-of-group domain-containing protein [Chthoniobacterales bacterium]
MAHSNFFAELKRRNVYKVAVAYAVAAWLLIQGASIFLPAFDAPPWAMKACIIVLMLGFPVALVLSWAFEITPEGIKRESEVETDQSITRRTGRKIVGITLALAVGAAGLLAFQLLRPKSMVTPRQSEAATAPIPAKSVAVLPFENMSSDKENAYFADGIQEEILTRLAKIGDLKVISRTSTEKYKSAPSNLREIAQQLGVANILEGSVQKSRDQVRITVQLINALNDNHLWAETYDRSLIDTFAVESDVAQRIASSLAAKLSGAEKQAIAARPTENSEAYQLYLKGRFFWNKRTGTDLKLAGEFFEQAVAADPTYSGAYAGLAQTYLLIPVFGAGRPRDFFPKANIAARRAVELDATSAEGHAALAMLQLFDFKFESSELEFQRAIELNPNYATAHHWFGNSLLVTLGRFDQAIKEGERAIELDPLSLIINADLGSTLMIARRYDQAIAQLRKTLALDGNFAYARWNLGEALYHKGDLNAAISEYEKAATLDDDPEILALLGRAYAETGQKEKALDMLRRITEAGQKGYVRGYLYTIIYIGLGDKEKALYYLEKASDDGESPDTSWLKVDPLFDPLRTEPRFQQLVAKMFPPEPK